MRCTAGGNSGTTGYGNDFIELRNIGTSPVDVTGWSVQYKSAAGTGAFTVTPVSGVIPAGAHYLVQEGSFTTGVPLPEADAVGSISMAVGGGVVALVSNTTSYPTFGTSTNVDLAGVTANGLVDVVGYGTSASTFEGARTGVATTQVLSAQRSAGDSDHNANDYVELAPAPQNCSCAPVTAPELVVSEVYSHGSDGGADGADFVEIFNHGSKVVDLSQATLNVAGGAKVALTGTLAAGAYLTVDGALPDADGSVELIWENDSSRIDLVGWGTGAHEGAASAPAGSATESAQRDEDNTDTDENGVDFISAVPSRGTAYAPPPAPFHEIAAIQGTGGATPWEGQRVRTNGVVTASYASGSGNLAGFYLQTGGVTDTPDASDAVFVYMGAKPSPAVGASVEVTGEATEFNGQTQIVPGDATDVDPIAPLPAVVPGTKIPGTGCAVGACPPAADINAMREPHEGEAYLPDGDFTVTDSYSGGVGSSAFRGEFLLAANSTEPLMLPLQVARPDRHRRPGCPKHLQRRPRARPRRRGHRDVRRLARLPLAHPVQHGARRRCRRVRPAGDPRLAFRPLAAPAERPHSLGRRRPRLGAVRAGPALGAGRGARCGRQPQDRHVQHAQLLLPRGPGLGELPAG